MDRIRRRLNAVVNPVSTAASRWWCHSSLRRVLTGHGPTARQKRAIRHSVRGTGSTPSAEQMEKRRKAIDDLLSRFGHEMWARTGSSVAPIISLLSATAASM
jgi:hypothetical protein